MIEKTPDAALREHCLIYMEMVYEFLHLRQNENHFISFQEKHRMIDRYNALYKVANTKYDDKTINKYLIHKFYGWPIDE